MLMLREAPDGGSEYTTRACTVPGKLRSNPGAAAAEKPETF
jgi:hypothetical protein